MEPSLQDLQAYLLFQGSNSGPDKPPVQDPELEKDEIVTVPSLDKEYFSQLQTFYNTFHPFCSKPPVFVRNWDGGASGELLGLFPKLRILHKQQITLRNQLITCCFRVGDASEQDPKPQDEQQLLLKEYEAMRSKFEHRIEQLSASVKKILRHLQNTFLPKISISPEDVLSINPEMQIQSSSSKSSSLSSFLPLQQTSSSAPSSSSLPYASYSSDSSCPSLDSSNAATSPLTPLTVPSHTCKHPSLANWAKLVSRLKALETRLHACETLLPTTVNDSTTSPVLFGPASDKRGAASLGVTFPFTCTRAGVDVAVSHIKYALESHAAVVPGQSNARGSHVLSSSATVAQQRQNEVAIQESVHHMKFLINTLRRNITTTISSGSTIPTASSQSAQQLRNASQQVVISTHRRVAAVEATIHAVISAGAAWTSIERRLAELDQLRRDCAVIAATATHPSQHPGKLNQTILDQLQRVRASLVNTKDALTTLDKLGTDSAVERIATFRHGINQQK